MTSPPDPSGAPDAGRPPLPSWQPPAAATDPATDPELRAAALTRLEEVKAFKIHLTVYAAVIGFLVAVWLVTGGGYFWPIWPMLGWGLGLGLHAASLRWEREPTEEEISEQARRILEQRGGRPAPGRQGVEGPQDTL